MRTIFYSHIPARRLISLPVCFVLSLVLIFGSISSSPNSITLLTKAFADDMMGGGGGGQGMPSPQEAPATTDAITDAPSARDGDDGDNAKNDDDSNDMPKDAPVTTGTLTAGGDSDNDDDDDDSGRDNDDDNDNEPTSKDAPVSTDALAAKKIECPKGQEVSLFSTSCTPVGGAENPGNSGDSALATTSCPTGHTPTSYGKPKVLDQSSVLRLEDDQQFQIRRGIFYYMSNDNGIQQQGSYFHQAELGKAYNPSSFGNCDIKQVQNPDGSITATVTRPGERIDVIKTDKTQEVVIQENAYSSSVLFYSGAIDDNGVATQIEYDVEHSDPRPLHAIRTTEPGGNKPTISLIYNPSDGSIKVHDRPFGTSVYINNLRDDNDGDPTVATDKNGMKATLKPFNEVYPTGDSKDDPLTTATSGHMVFRVTDPDSSIKTQMIINPDGTVQPGPKWTSEEPVEPANEREDPGD